MYILSNFDFCALMPCLDCYFAGLITHSLQQLVWFQTNCNRQVQPVIMSYLLQLTLKVLVATIDAQWEGMGDVGSARYEPALLPPCPTIRVLSYSN